jgi:hypothetical protein
MSKSICFALAARLAAVPNESLTPPTPSCTAASLYRGSSPTDQMQGPDERALPLQPAAAAAVSGGRGRASQGWIPSAASGHSRLHTNGAPEACCVARCTSHCSWSPALVRYVHTRGAWVQGSTMGSPDSSHSISDSVQGFGSFLLLLVYI